MVLYKVMLYSTMCRLSGNLNIALISRLVAEIYSFEYSGGTSQNTNFDKLPVNYVK
jgi:hypothetical protein